LVRVRRFHIPPGFGSVVVLVFVFVFLGMVWSVREEEGSGNRWIVVRSTVSIDSSTYSLSCSYSSWEGEGDNTNSSSFVSLAVPCCTIPRLRNHGGIYRGCDCLFRRVDGVRWIEHNISTVPHHNIFVFYEIIPINHFNIRLVPFRMRSP
jgi:hypothetical protein